MIDFVKSAFRNLRRKSVRTALTVLGIAIGVASVIIISNISQCGTSALSQEMDSLGMSGLSVTTNTAAGQNVLLDDTDLYAIQKLNQVEQAAPILMQNTNVSLHNQEQRALLWGIDSKADDIVSLKILYGRFFTRKDITTQSNVCLVDQSLARAFYKRDNIIGKKIPFLCGMVQEEFTVIGIVKTGSGLLQNFIGSYIPTFIYIPYTTLQSGSGRSDFDEIAVKIKPGCNAEKVGRLITNRLDSSAGTANAFVSENLAKQKDGLDNILNIVTLILSAIGAISLLVAGLSIMTVMLVSVNERTREIGIKKALGASRMAIMTEFLFEAVLLSLIGCILGIAAGYLISYAGETYFKVYCNVRLDILIFAMGFAMLSGTIFGVYPAYKASCLKPVDALRQE